MTTIEPTTLKRGPLRFSALQAGSGPAVLMLHGFPDTVENWRPYLSGFAESGFTALAVSLRGYEPDSQPLDNDYGMTSLVGDVLAWLDQKNIERVHLVGHDWGAAIAYETAARHPDRVHSLVTLAVPHSGRFTREAVRVPRQLRLSWYMFFFQLRGLSEAALRRNDFRLIESFWRRWSPNWDVPADTLDSVKRAFTRPGVLTAALRYYRAAMSPGVFLPGLLTKDVFKVPVPTLAMVGEADGCIDADVFERLTRPEDFPAGVTLCRIASAGHWLHLEKFERCFEEIVGHVQQVAFR